MISERLRQPNLLRLFPLRRLKEDNVLMIVIIGLIAVDAARRAGIAVLHSTAPRRHIIMSSSHCPAPGNLFRVVQIAPALCPPFEGPLVREMAIFRTERSSGVAIEFEYIRIGFEHRVSFNSSSDCGYQPIRVKCFPEKICNGTQTSALLSCHKLTSFKWLELSF